MQPNIPDELFAVLTEAVAVALREMAGVECGAIEGAPPLADISAVLPVTTAAGVGYLALLLPEATAAALARRVLAFAEAAVEPEPAVIRDCAGEVINVMAGQAKTLLYGTPYHFVLSTPRVESGASVPGGEAFVIAFGSEVGEFALRAYLPV